MSVHIFERREIALSRPTPVTQHMTIVHFLYGQTETNSGSLEEKRDSGRRRPLNITARGSVNELQTTAAARRGKRHSKRKFEKKNKGDEDREKTPTRIRHQETLPI